MLHHPVYRKTTRPSGGKTILIGRPSINFRWKSITIELQRPDGGGEAERRMRGGTMWLVFHLPSWSHYRAPVPLHQKRIDLHSKSSGLFHNSALANIRIQSSYWSYAEINKKCTIFGGHNSTGMLNKQYIITIQIEFEVIREHCMSFFF